MKIDKSRMHTEGLIVVDNYYPDPDSVRAEALKMQFTPYYYEDRGSRADGSFIKRSEAWKVTSVAEIERIGLKQQEQADFFSNILGEPISLKHWSFPLDWNGVFHVKHGLPLDSDFLRLYRPDFTAGIHNHIYGKHSVGPNGWAAVIYLSKAAPINGGLAVWRPKVPRDESHFIIDFDFNGWELVSRVDFVYNRMVMTRGNVFHTSSCGWGTTLEDSRLFQTYFVRVQRDKAQAAANPEYQSYL